MVPPTLIAAAGEATTIVKHFRGAGATSPGAALSFAPAGKLQEAEFGKLIDKGALVEMRRGTYYLNEEKLAASHPAGAVAALILIAGAFLLAGLLTLILRN